MKRHPASYWYSIQLLSSRPIAAWPNAFVSSQFITWWTKEYSTPPLCSTLRADAPKLPLKYSKIIYLRQEVILGGFYLKRVKVHWGVIPFCRYNPKAQNFQGSDVWLVLMIVHCLHVLDSPLDHASSTHDPTPCLELYLQAFVKFVCV